MRRRVLLRTTVCVMNLLSRGASMLTDGVAAGTGGGTGCTARSGVRYASGPMEYETLTEAEWSQVDRAWELLDDGKVAEARAEVDNLYGKRPGHADLRIIEAALQIEEGQASRALQALQGA